MSGGKRRVLESTDLDLLALALGRMFEAELPCRVDGGLHWLLCRSGAKWMLGIFNNEGVDRSVEKGDVFLPEAERKAVVCFAKAPGELRMIKSWPEGGSFERLTDGRYGCTIPAGGFRIVEFHS